MADLAPIELINDLEDAVKGGSSDRRVRMLRQVTDLFLAGADRLSESQVELFGDVLVRLTDRIEAGALSRLSMTLADLAVAPREAVRQLAFHEEAVVAAPVLLKSECLDDADLIEIASKRGQDHLVAISGRRALNKSLTDVLLRRGGQAVRSVLANNVGARFSDEGFSVLVANAERDEQIAESVGLRADLPPRLLRELVSKATDVVRQRLLSQASPELRATIESALQDVTAKIEQGVPKALDCSEAYAAVTKLSQSGQLDDPIVAVFATRRQYTYVIASLAILSAVSTEAIQCLMDVPGCTGLVVACRAAQLSWPTTLAIINHRNGIERLSPAQTAQHKQAFESLSLPSAQRTIRFWSARTSAAKSA